MNTPGDDIDRRLYALAVQAKEELNADRCTIYQLDREKNEVWSRVALGLVGQSIRLPTSRGLVGAVARTGQTLNLKDAYNDPRFNRETDQRTGYRTKSLLTMAIRDVRRRVIGVFQVLNKETDFFTNADETGLARYCELAAQVLASEASQTQT